MKRKAILLSTALLAGGTMFLNSCKKDELSQADRDLIDLTTEENVNEENENLRLRDSLAQVNGVYSLSVNVIDGTTTAFRSGGLEGINVSVTQYGVTKSATTDANGLVSFDDFRYGSANVVVNHEDYVNVTATVNIGNSNDATSENNPIEGTKYSALMLPVFQLTQNVTTIKGKVTAELDLTNETVESLEGVTVNAYLDNFQSLIPVGGNANVSIVNYSMSDVMTSGVTDANGEYTLTLPSSVNGINYSVNFGEVVAEQTMFEVDKTTYQTSSVAANTLFRIGNTPTTIPVVTPANINFPNPTEVVSEAEETQEEVEFYLDQYTNFSSQNAFYTDNDGTYEVKQIKLGFRDPAVGSISNVVDIIVAKDDNLDQIADTVKSVDLSDIEFGIGYTTAPNVELEVYNEYFNGSDPLDLYTYDPTLGTYVGSRVTNGPLTYGKDFEVSLNTNGSVLGGYKISIDDSGEGYLGGTWIRIVTRATENSKPANGHVLVNANGEITGVRLTENGEGYSEDDFSSAFVITSFGNAQGTGAEIIVGSYSSYWSTGLAWQINSTTVKKNGSGYLTTNKAWGQADNYYALWGNSTSSVGNEKFGVPTDNPSTMIYDAKPGQTRVIDLYMGTGERMD